jgi:integrase
MDAQEVKIEEALEMYSRDAEEFNSLLGGLGGRVPYEVVRDLRVHDLRRTVGSRLAMSGANAATISAALGHLSPDSARAYVHLTTEPVRAAIEKALGLDGA